MAAAEKIARDLGVPKQTDFICHKLGDAWARVLKRAVSERECTSQRPLIHSSWTNVDGDLVELVKLNPAYKASDSRYLGLDPVAIKNLAGTHSTQSSMSAMDSASQYPPQQDHESDPVGSMSASAAGLAGGDGLGEAQEAAMAAVISSLQELHVTSVNVLRAMCAAKLQKHGVGQDATHDVLSIFSSM